MKLIYPAIFKECEEGRYAVSFPDLPGCFTEGDNMADALFMAQDAASGWVLDELESGNTPPEASNVSDIDLEEAQFINLVALDMDEYSEKYGNKAVKKTLTIPAWMNTFIEKKGVSCSKLLQDAINKIATAN